MSDWTPGDFALCIRKGGWKLKNVGPKRGEIRRVTEVLASDDVELLPGAERNSCFLGFEEWLPDYAYGDTNFVKVSPTQADDFDREVIRGYGEKVKGPVGFTLLDERGFPLRADLQIFPLRTTKRNRGED